MIARPQSLSALVILVHLCVLFCWTSVAASFVPSSLLPTKSSRSTSLAARRSRTKQSFNPRNIETFQPNNGHGIDDVSPPRRKQTQKQQQQQQPPKDQQRQQLLQKNQNQTIDYSNLPRTLDPAEALFTPDLISKMARRMLVWPMEQDKPQRASPPLPRWHPHGGIADVNPQFRTKPPPMDGQGYAGTIWRNARKRNKPSLWRHALRTYTDMAVPRDTIHHEGALLACAKLGLWQEALDIYKDVDANAKITDNMIMSLVKACVRTNTREPLDAARDVALAMQSKHQLPLTSRHLNPIAAAYQKLGLWEESRILLKEHLADRTSSSPTTVNVFNIVAKDKASYALLVQSAVSNNEWADAVNALAEMTDAGLYPKQRHLNSWHEVVDNRNNKGWKQKRDEYWLESV